MPSYEFRHKDAVSGRVRENEYEHIRQHIINNQATGMMLYASSATQINGLPIGSTNQILTVAAGKPAWTSGPTLTTLTLTGKLTLSPSARITTHLEISGTDKLANGEQAMYINFPLETLATNGIWITLGSTVTSGDLTGIRSRVTGNAASAGANVRGAYLEAKAGASKFVAMLEGALVHADYSAGSVTVSGDVRGLTAHISQGAGLNAANLYGILVSIQTRGDESITTDDVGLMIRNEAVGGNGRTMDAGIKIAELNMGGGTKPFTVDIMLQNGTTITDSSGYLTIVPNTSGYIDIGTDIRNAGSITLKPSGDTDDYFTFAVASNIPTIYGTGAYLRIGDAATTSHSLASEDDLMVTGKLEVNGVFYPNAITLGGTVTGGNQNLNNLGHIGLANEASLTTAIINADEEFTDTTNSAYQVMNLDIHLAKTSAVYTGILYGIYMPTRVLGTNTQNWTASPIGMTSYRSYLITTGGGTGTITGAANFWASTAFAGAACANWYGLYVETPTGASALANAYGIYISDMTKGTTLDYGIYIVGADTAAIYVAADDIILASGNLQLLAGYAELTEMSAPGAGAANTARIYALEGAGDALTDLCAVFQDGTIDVFAQESTEPDSPIFKYPDNTELKTIMRKPDRKTIQFVAQFPNGREFVLRELRYPVERW